MDRSSRTSRFPLHLGLLCLYLTAAFPSNVTAQFAPGTWKYLSASPDAGEGHTHADVFFINESTGWIVNSASQVFRTDDAGDSWIKSFDGLGLFDFRAVAFADEGNGWIGTNTPGHILFETQDGGFSWIDVTSEIEGATPAGLSAFSVVDENTVYATGSVDEGPWILSTNSGGQSWSGKKIGSQAKTATDIHFSDSETGLITGGTQVNLLGDAVVLKTEDGGETWLELIPTFKKTGVDGEWGSQLSFPSASIGYLSVEYFNNRKNRFSKIMKTEDRGFHWSEIEVFDNIVPFGLRGVGFITNNIGWTSGSGISSVTVNGGVNWESLKPYSPAIPDGEMDGGVVRIFPVNDALAFAVGRYVYRYDEVEITTVYDWAEKERPARATDIRSYPNPFSDRTNIDVVLDKPARIEAVVYDVVGSRVKTLMDEFAAAGRHVLYWDGQMNVGRRAAPGLYFVSIHVNGTRSVGTLHLIRH